MPQNDYTITTDPSGALLQDIDFLIYTNRDLSYIPQFNHSYVLTDVELKKQSQFFTPYTGPANMARPGFMTYASVQQSINITLDYIIIGNGQTLSAWDGIKLFNIYRFNDDNAITQGVAYNSSNNLIYAARVTTTDVSGIVTYSSEIRAISVLAQTEILVDVSNISFSYIKGMNFDMSNNLYVTDYDNNIVVKIVLTDNYTGVGTIVANNFIGINGPNDVTNDGFGNLYISNSASNNVIKISPTGVSSIFASGFNNPMQIQYDYETNIMYVANYGQPSSPTDVYISSISNGVVSNVYSNSEYYFYGIAIKPYAQGIYYSASLTNVDASINTTFIGRLTYDNVGTNSAGYYTDAFSNYTIHPNTSVALNSSNTKLYAAQYNAPWPNQPPYDPSHNPYPYGIIWNMTLTDPSYIPVIFYPLNPTTDPSMNNPTTIAFDASDNLYVGNSIDSKILVIDTLANGTYLDVSGVILNSPTGFVFDNASPPHLYFANYSSNTICKLTFTTSTIATGITLPITGAPISRPTSLAFDAVNNVLYIANSGLNNILLVNLTTYVATIYNTTGSSIQSPSGLVYDSTRGLLYISNPVSDVINVLANNGETSTLDIRFESSLNPAPPNPDVKLKSPQGLTIDPSENILYIANYGNTIDAIVKVNIDVISNTEYNSYSDSISGANDISFYYDLESIDYIFISADASYVPILTAAGDLVNYSSDPNLKTSSSCNVRPIKTNVVDSAPYYAYYHTSVPPSIRAVVPDLNSLDPIYDPSANTTTGNINITGDTPDYASALKMRFDSKAVDSSINLYVSDASNICITKILITPPNYLDGFATKLNINFDISGNTFRPGRMTFLNKNLVYCIEEPSNSYTNVRICKIVINHINPLPAAPYTPTIVANFDNVVAINGTAGLGSDPQGYVYVIVTQQFGALEAVPYYYRMTTDASYTIEQLVSYEDVLSSQLQFGINIAYDRTDDSIGVACDSSVEKIYLSFRFVTFLFQRRIGKYSNTLYIADVVNDIDAPIVDFSFNVYQHYIIIDPSIIPPDTSTNASFYFINPLVLPNPTDTYYLECGTTKTADAFCNNCTYNGSKFLAGTYPTGITYSSVTNRIYVALQNNTISRIDPSGVVYNNFVPSSVGLSGPTSIELDSSGLALYVLNATGGFISKLTSQNNVIIADNTFYTNINTPICMTYDYVTGEYLYLLSGPIPNIIITQIDIQNPSNSIRIPIPFFTLYDSNGLAIGSPTIYERYLYVSNTDQYNVNTIKQFDLLDPTYSVTTLATASNLLYKPYTLKFVNQYLYIANKDEPGSLSKIHVVYPGLSQQPWAVNGINVPSDLTPDTSGNLYIANSGTNPRNSRISKIYVNYFPFNNIVLADGTCEHAQIYDVTTKSYVELDYYPYPDIYSFPIPFPGPS